LEQRIGYKGELFMKSSVQNRTKKSMGECLELHEKIAGVIYDAAIVDGQLPKEISFKTYKDIGAKLIMAAYENEVSAAAIRAISVGSFHPPP
jgi:predicted HTH transcriptional regulator